MIRVLIERRVATGHEDAYRAMMHSLRREAVHTTGYISGETLHDVEDPLHYVIISTWRSAGEWAAWHASAERRAMMDEVSPMLVAPESIRVMEPS